MPPYVVQPGDTLSEIAQRFGSSVECSVKADLTFLPNGLS
jgi:hypothetical protein